jgi:hypothetical protein
LIKSSETEQLIKKHTAKGENMPENVQFSLSGKAQEFAGEIREEHRGQVSFLDVRLK